MNTIPLGLATGILMVALTTAAQSQSRQGEASGRIAELERQVTQLTQRIEQLRADRLAEPAWSAASMPFRPPLSALQRPAAVSTHEVGCPAGAVCLIVRCDAPPAR